MGDISSGSSVSIGMSMGMCMGDMIRIGICKRVSVYVGIGK